MSYRDFFQHVNKDKTVNEVVRFGINVNKIVLDKDNKISGELDAIDVGGKAPSTVKSSQYKLEDAQKILHYNIEKETIKDALLYLFDPKADNKTVIVDILARANGVVKTLEDKVTKGKYTLENHSVVLFKNSVDNKHDIVVIDPNNFLYSSHLSNVDINDYLKQEKNIGEKLNKIVAIHKEQQIYKAEKNKDGKENVGPNIDQYRDCIDIAVKLAFGFNSDKVSKIEVIKPTDTIAANKNIKGASSKAPVKIETDNIKLEEIKTVKAVSNNPKIDKKIIDIEPSTSDKKSTNPIPIKIKQASDVKIVNSFNKAEDIINKKLKCVVPFILSKQMK